MKQNFKEIGTTRKKGFTLIELIITIAIIAIIAAIAVPRITKANKSSAENSLRDDLNTIQQAVTEAKMSGIPAATAFEVKNAIYTRGIKVEIPSSLGTEQAVLKSTDLIDVALTGETITITQARGTGAGTVGQVTYLGDTSKTLSNATAAKATLAVRETSLVAGTTGLQPIVSDRNLGNKKYMTQLYKGLGVTNAVATTLGEMDRTKQIQAMKEIFGDTVTTGKNGVEPIVELKQVDLIQLQPYMSKLKKLADSTKNTVYTVVSTNRTGNMTTTGAQGFGTNLITANVAEEITNKIVPGTLIIMPADVSEFTTTQSSGFEDALFTLTE